VSVISTLALQDSVRCLRSAAYWWREPSFAVILRGIGKPILPDINQIKINRNSFITPNNAVTLLQL